MIRAVVFDYFGTLTISASDADYSRQRGDVAVALGADPVAFELAVRHSFDARARGATGDLPTTLAELARSVGADPSADQVSAAVTIRLNHEWTNASRIRNGAVEVLEALVPQGLPRGVLSDCSYELTHHWEALPLAPHVDVAVLSFLEQRRKPEREMYVAVTERLGVAAVDCLYVGDGGSDELAGAAAVGMTPLRLRTPDHLHHTPYDRDPTMCAEITDLREVLTWV